MIRLFWVGREVRGTVVLTLVFGLLALTGCVSHQNTGAATIGEEIGAGALPQRVENPAHDGPPPVLFVSFVATPQDVVDRMLKMARVTSDDVVYDLGCGDGRIVVAAAERYGCRAVGYDLDRLRVEEARENARRNGVAHLVTIEQKDILTIDLQEATVVTIYMGTEMNARLIPQLRRLGPGVRIVSHEFGLGSIPPDRTIEMTSREDDRKHRLYLWRCPLDVVE